MEVDVPDYSKSNLLMADFSINYDWKSEDINTMDFNANLKDYEPSRVKQYGYDSKSNLSVICFNLIRFIYNYILTHDTDL